MKVLINGSFTKEIALDSDENEQLAEKILNLSATGDAFNEEIGQAIKQLWADGGIQQTFSHANEFQLNDSAKYYFDSIDRIVAPDYLPNQDDVLRSRVRTTGIVETVFTVSGLHFRMVDVGGQRNERKKWIHCFQEVAAIIFVTSLSEYDQMLYEDETQNRMKESLTLFDEICNSRWFQETSMILFLNKTDLFRDKIERTDLSVAFPEYTGGKDFDNASKFITEKFLELNKNPNKTIYVHLTCATDTQNVKVIFAAVKDTIVQTCLRAAGFM
jgi:guanine nucleotide-binding protein G(i) subunit alpha